MCRPTNSRNQAKNSSVLYIPQEYVFDGSVPVVVQEDTLRQEQQQQHHIWLDVTTLRRSPVAGADNDMETNTDATNAATANDVVEDVVISHQERLNRIVNRARTVVQTLNYRQRFLLFVKMLTAFVEKHYRQNNNSSKVITNNDNNDATAAGDAGGGAAIAIASTTTTTITPTPPILLALRNVLVDSISRYRAGDENYMPLEETICMRLRDIAGIQLYWNLTRDYLGYDLSEEQR